MRTIHIITIGVIAAFFAVGCSAANTTSPLITPDVTPAPAAVTEQPNENTQTPAAVSAPVTATVAEVEEAGDDIVVDTTTAPTGDTANTPDPIAPNTGAGVDNNGHTVAVGAPPAPVVTAPVAPQPETVPDTETGVGVDDNGDTIAVSDPLPVIASGAFAVDDNGDVITIADPAPAAGD